MEIEAHAKYQAEEIFINCITLISRIVTEKYKLSSQNDYFLRGICWKFLNLSNFDDGVVSTGLELID